MTRLLRSLLRVRLLWLPAVGLLFALAVAGAGWLLSLDGGSSVVVAGFLTVAVVLVVGFLWRL